MFSISCCCFQMFMGFCCYCSSYWHCCLVNFFKRCCHWKISKICYAVKVHTPATSQTHALTSTYCVCVSVLDFYVPSKFLCCYCRTSRKIFPSASGHIDLKHWILVQLFYLFFIYLFTYFIAFWASYLMQMQIYIDLVRMCIHVCMYA